MMNPRYVQWSSCAATIRRCQWPVWVLFGAVAVFGATQTHANVMCFDNPAGNEHFVWYGGTSSTPIGLEVISDAASQTGAYNGTAQFHQANNLPSNDFVSGPAAGGQLQVGGYANLFLVGVDAGAPIPSGTSWGTFGYIYHPNFGTWLPDDTPTYLGVEFTMGDGNHYGWIYAEKFIATDGSHQLDALAWAYETNPGVPIMTPEPGTLAMLACGAIAVLRRRR